MRTEENEEVTKMKKVAVDSQGEGDEAEQHQLDDVGGFAVEDEIQNAQKKLSGPLTYRGAPLCTWRFQSRISSYHHRLFVPIPSYH